MTTDSRPVPDPDPDSGPAASGPGPEVPPPAPEAPSPAPGAPSPAPEALPSGPVATQALDPRPAPSGPLPERLFRLDHLLRQADAPAAAQLFTNRLLNVLAKQPLGSRLTLTMEAERNGQVNVTLAAWGVGEPFGGDLVWCGEHTHVWEEVDPVVDRPRPAVLREAVPAVREQPLFLSLTRADLTPEGHALVLTDTSEVPGTGGLRPRALGTWPNPLACSGMDLLRTLRSTGGVLRIHLAPATAVERLMLQDQVLTTEGRASVEAMMGYMGTPVRMRMLLGVDEGEDVPARLEVAVDGLASDMLYRPLGDEEEPDAVWGGGEDALQGHAVPQGMARGLVKVPAAGIRSDVVGVPCLLPTIPDVPVAQELPATGLRLGTAPDASGRPVTVRLGVTQACQHVQVLGASGAGKSTLAAGLIASALEARIGVTLIDPHGTLVSRVATELTPGSAHRVHVVRTADLEHPTPLNPFAGRDCEDMVGEVLEILYAIFDPRHEGIIGPRFERLFRQTMAALRILLEDRATLTLVPQVLASRQRLKDVANAVATRDAELARELRSELVDNRSSDFSDILAWVSSKFDRLVRSSAMRAVFGSGYRAIDVAQVVERGEVLLIDLAAPRIGADQAAFTGMVWLMEHALAMGARGSWERPHLVVVDEAHLFQAGGLSELLAEGRKFGVGVVIAHQHMGQLSASLGGAVEANASTVVGLRSSIRDAPRVEERIGTWSGGSLSRLPNMRAATTLATPKGQTQAFTLTIDHNERAERQRMLHPDWAERATAVTEARRRLTSSSQGGLSPLGSTDVDRAVRRLCGALSQDGPGPAASTGRSFLDELLKSHQTVSEEDE